MRRPLAVREAARHEGLGAQGPRHMLIPKPAPAPPSESDHVRTDPDVRRHRQALALELRVLMHARYRDARPISYREVDRLVAAHDGDVPLPQDALGRLRLEVVRELLAKRRGGA
jgi:hypothetical protein